MGYLMLVIVILSINDILYLRSRGKKEICVYLLLMVLVGALVFFYYSDTERDSFAKIIFSLIGKEG